LRDYKLYLHDIKEAVEKIEIFTRDLASEDFVQDIKTVDAVIRNLEIIGEASKHIPKKMKERYSDVDWKAIIGMRNIVVHEYFGVNLEILWKTVRSRLPELRTRIEEILREAEGKGKG
jgi:uncharacterized protein with HEPN domain